MDVKKSNEELKAECLTSSYEAPRIEAVLTPEELEREVLYAGNSVS
jgi:hypothetical protein